MKVSISKLLKTKNRLASEITRVRAKILAHNSYQFDENDSDYKPAVDVINLKAEHDSLVEKLIAVKSALSAANVKSVDKIFRLSEVKGQIAFYDKLNTTEGKERNYYNQSVRVNCAQISTSAKDQIISNLIKEAERLQDDLDQFNASHRVELDDSLFL